MFASSFYCSKFTSFVFKPKQDLSQIWDAKFPTGLQDMPTSAFSFILDETSVKALLKQSSVTSLDVSVDVMMKSTEVRRLFDWFAILHVKMLKMNLYFIGP